jgi:hypothetical protein
MSCQKKKEKKKEMLKNPEFRNLLIRDFYRINPQSLLWREGQSKSNSFANQRISSSQRPRHFFIPGLDNTRLFMSFTAGAGTRCMSLLSSSPILKARADPELEDRRLLVNP